MTLFLGIRVRKYRFYIDICNIIEAEVYRETKGTNGRERESGEKREVEDEVKMFQIYNICLY